MGEKVRFFFKRSHFSASFCSGFIIHGMFQIYAPAGRTRSGSVTKNSKKPRCPAVPQKGPEAGIPQKVQ